MTVFEDDRFIIILQFFYGFVYIVAILSDSKGVYGFKVFYGLVKHAINAG